MWWVERFDAKRPEPAQALRRVAWLGGLSTLPALAVEYVLGAIGPQAGVDHALWTAFVVAACTEEIAKALALFFGVWRHPAFDERLDGIVYATRAGLGFALVENVGYLLDTKGTGSFIGVFVMRAVLAVPSHAIYAGFMGYWAARRRFDSKGPGLLGGLIIAILLHGTYDGAIFLTALLTEDTMLWLLPLLAAPVLVVVLGYRRLRTHAIEALRLDDLDHARAADQARLRLPFGFGFGFTLR
jgi:protease PrsW